MTSAAREAVRLAIDAAARTKLSASGSPHRRPEEARADDRIGSWIPVRVHHAHKPLSPFYCLAAYEGQEV